jgi:hypothetical protein
MSIHSVLGGSQVERVHMEPIEVLKNTLKRGRAATLAIKVLHSKKCEHLRVRSAAG